VPAPGAGRMTRWLTFAGVIRQIFGKNMQLLPRCCASKLSKKNIKPGRVVHVVLYGKEQAKQQLEKSRQRLGRMTSLSVARGCARVHSRLDTAKCAQTVVSTRIVPACVQFLGAEKRFHTAWVNSDGLAVGRSLPVHPYQQTLRDDRTDKVRL
jgi:hypothetical protein